MAATESLETMVARIDERTLGIQADIKEWKDAQIIANGIVLKHEKRLILVETAHSTLQRYVSVFSTVVGTVVMSIVFYVLKAIGFPTSK